MTTRLPRSASATETFAGLTGHASPNSVDSNNVASGIRSPILIMASTIPALGLRWKATSAHDPLGSIPDEGETGERRLPGPFGPLGPCVQHGAARCSPLDARVESPRGALPNRRQ